MEKFFKKRRQLKWNMVAILAVCWFLPLVLLSAVIFTFVNHKISGQLENTIVASADRAVEICQMRLDEVIAASKDSSYLPVIRESYERYRREGNANQLTQEVSIFMSQQYRYNRDITMTALYFTEEPGRVYYCYSNNNSGSTSAAVSAFKWNALESVRGLAEQLDTSVAFMNLGGRVYLVRNIVDSSFEPYAVIVMELNMDNILKGLDSIWGFQESDVFIDGISMKNQGQTDPLAGDFPQRLMEHSYYENTSSGALVYRFTESNRHRFAYLVTLDSTTIVGEMEAVKYVFFLLLAFMIPLIFIVFWFFHKRVNIPISRLRGVYKEIERENYGYHIDLNDSDEEFRELGESFNRMSDKLQYQFEKIYLEELALKDANIMALQSQINPHFLNNTLEIINWEARMNGNYKVSHMIEALSTMLEATMNRKGERVISLAEELSYVDAYLYIIAQRFGDKFQVEKEIDESLLSVKVPRLVIQPIVENAVEHGMDIRRGGRVKIVVHREEEKLLIEVHDNGVLTEEAKEKIGRLLSADAPAENRSLSLGISNVNKRLKIMYGPECGLAIKSDKDHFTVSIITVKIDKEEAQ